MMHPDDADGIMAVSGRTNPPSFAQMSAQKEGNSMATDEGTQGPLGNAPIVSRRRFLRETAVATAMVAVPYLAGKRVASGKESSTATQAEPKVPTLRSIAR
jgi:hypothetical protein